MTVLDFQRWLNSYGIYDGNLPYRNTHDPVIGFYEWNPEDNVQTEFIVYIGEREFKVELYALIDNSEVLLGMKREIENYLWSLENLTRG